MSNIVSGMTRRKVVGNPTIKAVLMFMADCASDDGAGVWTSKANMAADLELSKRSVQVAVAELLLRGLISEVGQKKCDRGFTVEYRVNVEAVEALKSTRSKPVLTGAGDSPVQEIHPKGCSTFTSTGAGDSPKPSLEPSLEPSNSAGDLFGASKQNPRDASIAPTGDEAFERFWKVYPRKDAKAAAKKNFDRAVKGGADLERIIEGARRYAIWLTSAKPGEFRPIAKFAQGWITDQRWNDEEIWKSGSEEDPSVMRYRAIRERAEAAGARH